MVTQVLPCPSRQGTDIVRHGKTPQGKQRYRCRQCLDGGHTFLLDYSSPALPKHSKLSVRMLTRLL